MFHNSYPSAFSYRTPVSQPTPVSPREKYLAALAEAKAAEAEYLAAERLQQEEDELRQRLEQIQRLKHQPTSYHNYTPVPQYPQVDLDALRRQIAAEERARIVREQELEALRVQEARKAQQARELEALRVEEARKAQQAARDIERSRALAARRAELEALTHRASNPVRIVVSEPTPRKHHAYPEFRNTVDLTPQLLAAAATKRQHKHNHDCGCEHKPRKVRFAADHKPSTQEVNLEDVFNQLFGGHVESRQEPKPKKAETTAPTVPQTMTLEQFIQHVRGASAGQQPQAQTQPPTQEAAPEAPKTVTVEQLINHFLGAAGNQVEQPKAPTTTASTSTATQEPKAQPTEEKEAAPSQSAASEPAPASANAGARPTEYHQVNLHQLLNMLFGGAAPSPASAQPQASSSKPASTSSPKTEGPAVKKTAVEEREERELAEAIRLSLAESRPKADRAPVSAPTTPASESASKGKAPAPAPAKDATTSTAEVAAIDASFTALANEFVFPVQLDFSSSRTSSPARGNTAEESVISKLTYNPQNQPVRFYHQALSGLLARLDEVESFGDEGVRERRKEVVGKVEGALDEVEAVVEARWRKWVGREREEVKAEETVSVEAESVPAPEPTAEEEEEEAPVVVQAEDTAPDAPTEEESVPAPVEVVESVTEITTAPEPTPSLSPAVEPEETPSQSYPPATEVQEPELEPEPSSSYPPSAAESVATLRPAPTPSPSSPAPSDIAAASPAPSDIDTFLLPADEEPVLQKKPRASESDADEDIDVGSDWSEVDA